MGTYARRAVMLICKGTHFSAIRYLASVWRMALKTARKEIACYAGTSGQAHGDARGGGRNLGARVQNPTNSLALTVDPPLVPFLAVLNEPK